MKYLTSLMGNYQKLDGGAMFGHVPKALWQKWTQPDEKNRISLACRALLIQEESRNILLETGIGLFGPPALCERYGIEESHHVLLNSLKNLGLTHNDIDIVILSHLHFDHAGGLLSPWKTDENQTLLFPKAQFVISQEAWNRACKPHIRDQASFIPSLTELLETSGRLTLINNGQSDLLGCDYHFFITHGHTPGLLHTVIETIEGPIIFASDLIPGRFWVHLPIGMGYDRSAELLLDEKREMLEWAVKNNARLFFTHDEHIAMTHVICDKDGKFKLEHETMDFLRLAS